mgnify:CR=1 FL=1
MNTHKALTYSTFVIQIKDNNVNFIPMKNLIKTGLLSVALLTSLVANASKIITTASAKDKVVYIGLTNISKGEVIEGDKYQKLSSLKEIYESQVWNKSNYNWIVFGYVILVVLALLMLILFVKKYRVSIYNNNTKLTFIFFWHHSF